MTFSVEGAWTRESVSLDGGEAFETQHVYWLQAGDCYADLRVPFHPAGATSCFAGRSGWDEGRFRWTHRLDLGEADGSNFDGDDIGDLRWDGDRLIETGMLGDIAYEEVWVRLPGDGGDSEVHEGTGESHVQVGDHAITIVDARPAGGTFGACYVVRTQGEWEIRALIGDLSDLGAWSP